MTIKGFFVEFMIVRSALIGLIVLLILALIGVLAPYLTPYEPTNLFQPFCPPSAEFILGTDHVGRDVLTNLMYGARVTLLFAFGSAGTSLLLGIILGAIPGYFGGIIDDLFSRVTDIMLMIYIQSTFLAILVVSLFGHDIVYLMLMIGLLWWPSNARMTRAQVITLKKRGYVKTAIAAGAGHFRILFRHILPNGIYPVLANSTLQMANAILFEAGLSFLGLGDPNNPTWGWIINLGLNYKWAWWLSVFPGIAIALTVFSFNLVGNGINEVMNPRFRMIKWRAHETHES